MFKFIRMLIKTEKSDELKKEQQELISSIKSKIEVLEKVDLDDIDLDYLREIEDILSYIL